MIYTHGKLAVPECAHRWMRAPTSEEVAQVNPGGFITPGAKAIGAASNGRF